MDKKMEIRTDESQGMEQMTPYNIAQSCGGILRYREFQEDAVYREITSVETDSRNASEGCLFAAIKGARVDGHRFIRDVFAKGALCVLTERDLTDEDFPEGVADSCCWIRVISTLDALKSIARFYLQTLGIPAVGIAGSVGKTSTKEMVASVLSQGFRVLSTQGNFNNELGVPLTIFRLNRTHEIAVLEMGISDFGEMHRLSSIVHPDTVVMTNIGDCHLENLGDRDGVLKAKSEIFDFLQPEGHILLNGNDEKLASIQEVHGILPVFYGVPGAYRQTQVCAEEISGCGLDGTDVRIRTPKGTFGCHVPMPGVHMVMNALAATAAGLTYGLSLDQICRGIESCRGVSGRFHLIHAGGRIIIDDCYNANPMSMKASLSILADADGYRTAILGDMAELGEREEEMHREIGAHAVRCGIQRLITIGERGRWILQGAEAELAREQEDTMTLRHYDTVEDFLKEADRETGFPCSILIKASHFMEFERIVKVLAGDKHD